jgi:tetrahydromethanopterin S-methyltransferase subunit A
LTSGTLNRAIAALPGVAIAGRLYTCNLGIEKIITNVCANPRIRMLMLCGQDSRLFRPGQALRSLMEQGVGQQMRIVGAEGYLPVLRGVSLSAVEQFRRQVVLLDRSGELNLTTIGNEVAALARQSETPEAGAPRQERADGALSGDDESRFIVLRPGGKREPLAYDPKGNFVITLDAQARRIVAHHYLPDMTPAHVMRSSSGEAMMLGLIHAGLVTQLTHAAYLGGEFAKAESALRLGLIYEQDQPLKSLA